MCRATDHSNDYDVQLYELEQVKLLNNPCALALPLEPCALGRRLALTT